MGGPARDGRSGGDAAHPARQFDHRRGGRRARGGAGRGGEIPRFRSRLLPRRQSGWAGCAPGATLEPDHRLGARDAGCALRAGRGRMFVPQPAEALAAAARAIPERAVAARRGQRHHHADGLGADCARRRAGPFVRRRRLGGRPCRRGLEHAPVGPRRAGARAPGRARGRDAGGDAGAGEAARLSRPRQKRRAVIFLANSGA